ncbi:hypothetical protein CVT26_009329 [Gymnopilus dilepis]|uniref:Uncharacterized protein n=1 Tax=Gymnopilus dilepis TaxID=231916 RepID=A0A409YA57_9AGAR|nr:hypothetical protein CVT26_009329 [Gymnopilus dilepis]
MALFDARGKALPWLCSRRSEARGSGCLGKELNGSLALYIKDVRVKDEKTRYRFTASQETLGLAHVGKDGDALCRPDATQEPPNLVNFVRKNGFRRPGLTPFFAYSANSTHASRKLVIASDPDPDTVSNNKCSSANNMDKDSIAAQQPKVECTCGERTQGWLSPRMRFRLSTQASLHRDAIGQDLYLFKESRTLSASTNFLDAAFDYLPPSLTRQISSTPSSTLSTRSSLKRKSPSLPTSCLLSIAHAENPNAIELFLAKGHKVEHVLDCVVDTAREECPLGEGSLGEVFCGEEFDEMVDGPGAAVDWDGPRFESVRRMLGIAGGKWGPYINA